MNNNYNATACSCHRDTAPAKDTSAKKMKRGFRSVPGALLSVGIVLFPKCPLCWAAYMSMFGSVGLTSVPYMKWLLPVLIGFLALHVFFIFRKIKEKGYGPFICSLAGAVIIISGRAFFAGAGILLFAGIALVLCGSLWNNFTSRKLAV